MMRYDQNPDDVAQSYVRRMNLHEFTSIKYIVGWAEKISGGWIGLVRDDAGCIVRTACIRPCESEAIRAARSLVAILRTEQIWRRKLYADCYPTLLQHVGVGAAA